MERPAQAHSKTEPRWGKIHKRIKEFLRVNLILSVVVFLITSWVGIAWLVYRAEIHGGEGKNITTFGEGLWWGIVTVLTIGYGDRYPVTVEGRLWGGVLMVFGVAMVGIVTAKISSYFLEQAILKVRGHVETDTLKDHFVVCGWKEEMHELLHHILDFNPGLTSRKLVLVANIKESAVESIREQPRLKDLQVIIGDYYRDVDLKRAAPERARKVLILADRSTQGNGQIASANEVDARTVMTAMTLSNIARGTLVTAEIIDPKMDHYLKLAGVSEIIYTREYSRLLLANASGSTGVSNVIFELLDPKNPTSINVVPIDSHFLEKRYPEFKVDFEKEHRSSVVIGILENTGNSHWIKERAVRQAQKTTDMNRLVQNLRSIKGMKCNHPVLNPGEKYLIPEGAMAIVIETRNVEASSGKVDTAAA